jgi:hypothetical protein
MDMRPKLIHDGFAQLRQIVANGRHILSRQPAASLGIEHVGRTDLRTATAAAKRSINRTPAIPSADKAVKPLATPKLLLQLGDRHFRNELLRQLSESFHVVLLRYRWVSGSLQ